MKPIDKERLNVFPADGDTQKEEFDIHWWLANHVWFQIHWHVSRCPFSPRFFTGFIPTTWVFSLLVCRPGFYFLGPKSKKSMISRLKLRTTLSGRNTSGPISTSIRRQMRTNPSLTLAFPIFRISILLEEDEIGREQEGRLTLDWAVVQFFKMPVTDANQMRQILTLACLCRVEHLHEYTKARCTVSHETTFVFTSGRRVL